jgi:hypothetical protein
MANESSNGPISERERPPKDRDQILRISGYAFVFVSVFCFGTIAYLKIQESLAGVKYERATTWFDLIQRESSSLSLLIIAVISAILGKRLLTSMRMADGRTIPYEDYPLISDAVKEGKSEPIDQYVRLRALSGVSGNFTKLGVTGLPLTTVFLTLVFSILALLPIEAEAAKAFLDLAKLTLGAFIGSFVQGRVEQRKQQDAKDKATGAAPRSDLVA